jgi:PAS domain S-box-containing protein
MFHGFSKFFTAPVFWKDEEKTRRARALNALHINMGSALLILGSIGVFFFFTEKVITSTILIAALLIIIFGVILNQRGMVQAAGTLMLGSLWVFTVIMSALSSGMQSLDIMFFISGTVAAGVILGGRGAYAYAVLSLLTGLGLIAAETAGVDFPQFFTFPPMSAWILLFINLVFTVVPLQVALQGLSDSVARSKSSEEQYRLIASVMSDYAFFVQFGSNGETTDQWISGAFESITGYSPHEYISKGGWLSILHPEDTEQDARDMLELYANRKVITEVRIVRKDGGIRWVRSYGHPKWNEETNRLSGIYGAVQDVTEHKRVESELRQRAEEVSLLYRLGMTLSSGNNLYQALRAFVEELKQVMTVDAFHIGLYDAATDIFSYSLFLNLDQDVLPPPRTLQESPGLTWEVISKRETLYLGNIADPKTMKEHKIVWVVDAPILSYIGIPLLLQERVIGVMSVQSVRAHAYTLNQVRLLETMAAQVSITIEKLGLLDQLQQELAERKRAEAELRQRETIMDAVAISAELLFKELDWRAQVNEMLERLGKSIHASHAYLFENKIEGDGRILTSMRYEWTAPNFESDLGDSRFTEVYLGEDDLDSWYATMRNGLAFIGDRKHLNQSDFEYVNSRGMKAVLDVPIFLDGQWWGSIGFDEMGYERVWSNAEADALRVAANVLAGAIKRSQIDSILQNELQQRKTLIEELENKNTELERFNYTVSHDLKTPLVTIRGFLGYLEEDMLKGNIERFKQDAKRIENAVDKMNNLLKDLLELSRVGRLMNPPVTVSFDELVHEALELVRGRLIERNVTVHTLPNLPIVYVDKPHLIMALQNLIDNAAKYMGDQRSPRIEIGMEGRENGQQVFFVRDNGMGINPEYHDQIFGLFNKLDVRSEGTGVGLALVKRIIEVNGGRIWVESETGAGSAFYFTLQGSLPL